MVWVDAAYNYPNNGQSELYEAVGAWIRANHPAEWPFLSAAEDLTAAERSRWLRLWEKYSGEYADAMAQ